MSSNDDRRFLTVNYVVASGCVHFVFKRLFVILLYTRVLRRKGPRERMQERYLSHCCVYF